MSSNSPILPENYLSFLEVCPDAVLIINEQGKIVFWNSATSRIFGYGPEEIINRPVSTVISGDLPYREETKSKAALKAGKKIRLPGAPQLIEIEGIRKNGTRFPLELSLIMYRESDGNLFSIAILRDITSRKQIEAELAQRARDLDLFFRFSLQISSPPKLDQLLKNVLGIVLDGMDIQRGVIHLLDESGERLLLKAHRDIPGTICRALTDRKVNEDQLTVQVLSIGKPSVETRINKVDELYRALAKSGEPCFFVYCPLNTPEETLGLMVLQGSGFREFTSNDMALLKAICRTLGEAVKHVLMDEETIRRNRELNLLQEVNIALNSAAGLNEVLDTIAGSMVKVFNYKGSIVFLDEQGKGRTITLKTFACDPKIIKKMEKLLGFPLKGHGFKPEKNNTFHRLYSEQLPVLSEDISASLAGLFLQKTLKKPASAVAGLLPVTSGLLAPMVVGKKVKGILVVAGQQDMGRRDISRVQVCATQAALAIEKALLFENEHRQMQVNEILREISQAIGSTLELDDVLHRILEQLKKVIDYQAAGIMLVDEERGKLYVKVVETFEKEAAKISLPLDGDRGVTVHAARTGDLQYVPDISKDKRYVSGVLTRGSELAVPLKIKDRVLGVLDLESEEIDAFSHDDIQLISAFANQAGIAIENALLYEQVKESEERFSDVTANTGDWIWEVDAEGRYTYSSPVLGQILGYTPQEVLGKHFYDFFCPEDREKLKSAAFEVFKSREPFTSFVNRNLHKNGQTVILETSGSPVIGPDGELSGYRGVDHDITARVKAEEALAASEHKYRILVEHANDWIWTLDLKGNFTFFNRAAEEASGYKCEDWLGRSFAPIILPEDLPHVQQIYARILAGKSQSYEVHVYKWDGKLLTLAVNTAPLYEGDKIVGTVNMGRDITLRKQLEEQLRQSQKMEALGTLAGGIAHDFNNILGGILGYASFIKSEFPPDASLGPEVDAVISLVRRAAELTNQLLAFARGGRYQIRPINLNDIVDEVVKLLSRTVDKAILIKPVLNPDLAAIEGDSGQIQQMILNLCLNARDAMPGSGQLLIETENVAVDEESADTLFGLKRGSYVLVSVSDTGTGIDPEIKARIFDPFFTTKEGQGVEKHSGLGLSMIYGIVRSHRGIIKVLLANGGREAVDLFRKRNKEIDLIILDMIMPDMNSTATYKQLKEMDPDVKVLLSSGYSKNRQAQELLDAGVRGFLQKPYELAQILHKVRQVLDED